MVQEQSVIEGWRGVCVACGLGTPGSRALSAALLTGVISYTLKMPRRAYNSDGSMRTTGTHFLLMPTVVGSAVFLFT